MIGQTYRHKKTGRLYTVEGLARLQSAAAPELDTKHVLLYRHVDGGQLFARESVEFCERFEGPVGEVPS